MSSAGPPCFDMYLSTARFRFCFRNSSACFSDCPDGGVAVCLKELKVSEQTGFEDTSTADTQSETTPFSLPLPVLRCRGSRTDSPEASATSASPTRESSCMCPTRSTRRTMTSPAAGSGRTRDSWTSTRAVPETLKGDVRFLTAPACTSTATSPNALHLFSFASFPFWLHFCRTDIEPMSWCAARSV